MEKAGGGDKLPWGTLLSLPTASNQVCQVSWKDSGLALMMSTVYEGTEYVENLRRRPRQGKKKEEQKHKPFQGQATKILRIPAIFHRYNMLMGAIDIFDHLTAMNAGMRRVRRGAHQALEHWILRGILANTYVVGQMVLGANKTRPVMRSQKEWRIRIFHGCIEAANRTPLIALKDPICSKRHIGQISIDAYKTPLSQHKVERIKSRPCQYCRGGRLGDRPLKRVALGELANRNDRISERHNTIFGYRQCKVSLCTGKRRCFNRWHGRS